MNTSDLRYAVGIYNDVDGDFTLVESRIEHDSSFSTLAEAEAYKIRRQEAEVFVMAGSLAEKDVNYDVLAEDVANLIRSFMTWRIRQVATLVNGVITLVDDAGRPTRSLNSSLQEEAA